MFHNSDRTYIVAEIGGNFIDFDKGAVLIDQAKECGVDAVKLQTYRADTITSRQAVFDMENTGIISQTELFKKYELSEKMQIISVCEGKRTGYFFNPVSYYRCRTFGKA